MPSFVLLFSNNVGAVLGRAPPRPAQMGGEIRPGVPPQAVFAHRPALPRQVWVARGKLPPAQMALLRRSSLKISFCRFLPSSHYFFAFFKKAVDKLTSRCYNNHRCERGSCCAGVAQLVEQLICNQQVGGSNPSTSSTFFRPTEYGGVPKWPKGTDCKSAGFAFDGSNPSSSTMPEQSPLRLSLLPSGWETFAIHPCPPFSREN